MLLRYYIINTRAQFPFCYECLRPSNFLLMKLLFARVRKQLPLIITIMRRIPLYSKFCTSADDEARYEVSLMRHQAPFRAACHAGRSHTSLCRLSMLRSPSAGTPHATTFFRTPPAFRLCPLPQANNILTRDSTKFCALLCDIPFRR